LVFWLEERRRWDTAEKRLGVLRELIVDGDVVSRICERHGISRMTFYRWLKAYRESGFEGLVKKSTRPKRVARTPRGIEAIIEELYTKMGMGCKNISQTVRPLYTISHMGVLRVLRRLGFVASHEKKRWKSFRAPHKNHMWQVDLLGPFSTRIGEISLVVALDDYSRFAMSKIVPRRGRTDHVTGFLDECIAKNGWPESVLTDRGSQFRRMFDRWCRKRKIKHVRATVRHPQTVGKVEAVNKILGRSFSLEFVSASDGQKRLDVFMAWYNFIHYNSVIESTPAEAYGLDHDLVDILGLMAHTFNLNHLLRGVTKKREEQGEETNTECNISPFT
jgi:putative transposase